MPPSEPPGPDVLAAFGAADAVPERLNGGAGRSWRVRGRKDIVLKPVDGPSAETEIGWWAAALPGVRAGATGIRLATPVPADEGGWTAGGWRADTWLAGEPRPDRPLDALAAAERFHAAVAPLPAPPFLARRTDRWALADRAAWGELEVEVPPACSDLARRLRRLTAPSAEPPQLVHLDLLGNVLLAAGLPPAVIDLSLYRRPAVHGSAVIVADALLHGGAADDLLRRAGPAGRPAAVARAVLFRLLDEGQQAEAAGGIAEGGLDPYERVAAVLERVAAARA